MRRSAGRQKHPRTDKLGEALRYTAQRGNDADGRDPTRQHEFARKDVSEASKRDANE